MISRYPIKIVCVGCVFVISYNHLHVSYSFHPPHMSIYVLSFNHLSHIGYIFKKTTISKLYIIGDRRVNKLNKKKFKTCLTFNNILFLPFLPLFSKIELSIDLIFETVCFSRCHNSLTVGTHTHTHSINTFFFKFSTWIWNFLLLLRT